MVFFYLVTTGWIFYISLCEISINSINQTNFLFISGRTHGRRKISRSTSLADFVALDPMPMFQMDQHFAEMLADRPAEMDKKDNREDGGRHLHNVKRHGEDGVSARQHGHDRMGAQSVGMELDAGPIDWAKFKSWLKNFLEREGELIWRLKGVLWTSAPGQSGGAAGTWSLGAGKRTVVQVKQ